MNRSFFRITGNKTDTYRFLTDRRFRPARHVVLILGILLISLSQNISRYIDSLPVMGTGIYHLALFNTVCYLAVAYLHIYRLAPRYLVGGRYGSYLLRSGAAVFTLLLVRGAEDYGVIFFWNLADKPSTLSVFALDSISDFALNYLCMAGVSLTVVLKDWLNEEAAIRRLENHRLTHEMEALKEVVDPRILLGTLHECGVSAYSDSGRSEEMILRLSGLLRYQLYESGRDKVFLTDEIGFIRDYLELERIRTGQPDYRIETVAGLQGVYVPPLLFTPFIRVLTGSSDTSGPWFLRFGLENDEVVLSCRLPSATDPRTLAPAIARMKSVHQGLFSFACRTAPDCITYILRLKNG